MVKLSGYGERSLRIFWKSLLRVTSGPGESKPFLEGSVVWLCIDRLSTLEDGAAMRSHGGVTRED